MPDWEIYRFQFSTIKVDLYQAQVRDIKVGSYFFFDLLHRSLMCHRMYIIIFSDVL